MRLAEKKGDGVSWISRILQETWISINPSRPYSA